MKQSESNHYRCRQCGAILVAQSAEKPFRCNRCGSYNIIDLTQDDRSTRFGETKPAKMVTK